MTTIPMENCRGLTLRDLGYIVAVADELNFHRAAERCFVTQSTLSNQIKKCERYLGVDIFDRDTHHVAITPLGIQLIWHARRALGAANAIKRLSKSARAVRADSEDQSRGLQAHG